jgi:hypothetical protein
VTLRHRNGYLAAIRQAPTSWNGEHWQETAPRATPLAGSPWAPCGRVRGPRAKLDEEPVTIDETDPWTGEAIPHERIAAPASRPLDNVDPWTGETIVVKGSALVQRETLDPYSAD